MLKFSWFVHSPTRVLGTKLPQVATRAALGTLAAVGTLACGTGDDDRTQTPAIGSTSAVGPTATTSAATPSSAPSTSSSSLPSSSPSNTAPPAGSGSAPAPSASSSTPPSNGLTSGNCTLGAGQQQGMGQTTEQYLGADVTRDGLNYRMITNGWGMGWDSHDISWLGTTLSINSYQGSRQDNGAPAGYPSVFCGRYSDTSRECGLPKLLSSVTAMHTATSWSHPQDDGTYNVAYDVWLGDSSLSSFQALQSYFMVWLKDPLDEGPAGSLREEGVTIPNAPGVWNIVDGEVNARPIVNYVRAEGDEINAIAFDIMDFIRDARARNLDFPGDDVLAVAIGFEIWQGPVTGLKLDDFCLDLR